MNVIKRLMVVFALGLATVTAHAGPALGEVPPDWLGKTPKGEEIRISDRPGKVVIVAFWASWCGYCQRELPVLEAIQQAAGRDRLEVVLVNYQEPPQTYREIVRKLRKSLLTLTHDRDGAISEAYSVNSVPRLYMVDKAGQLGWTYFGFSNEDLPEIGANVDRLLAEPWQPEQAASVAASETPGS